VVAMVFLGALGGAIAGLWLTDLNRRWPS
jgi:hypothetical protein